MSRFISRKIRLPPFSRKSCRDRFDGSGQLFNVCWRILREYRHHTDILTQDDADHWLQSIASEIANNPASNFISKARPRKIRPHAAAYRRIS